MRRNNEYILTEYQGNYYLIPSGQAAANHRCSFTTNELGAFIWNKLEYDTSFSDLVRQINLNENFNDYAEEALTDNIDYFISFLQENGLITKTVFDHDSSSVSLSIAGINIRIYGNTNILSPELQNFLSATQPDDYDISVTVSNDIPEKKQETHIIIESPEATIEESCHFFAVRYTHFSQIKEVRISKDYHHAVIYSANQTTASFQKELYLALRVPFLMSALSHGMIMLHSASILYNDMLYCFSAPSGTGKSTHTNLWKEKYPVSLINGDVNLLHVENRQVYAIGTPWCGTSGIFSVKKYPLGGIIYLKQSGENQVSELMAGESLPKMLARVITPNWNQCMSGSIIEIAKEINQLIPSWLLECTPDDNAVECIKDSIDSMFYSMH